MTTLTLDLAGSRMHRLGFGVMRLATEPDDARSASIELLRRAVELGVTLIDTAHPHATAPHRPGHSAR
ncbi:hypothetical protein NLM24_12745 [Nocardia zapadnayensis]|uniref:hypothetical protein n=1 Tax=Nocardia rhamnosiphila TaxID=426716 RepID=UPI00224819CE|nr:hypothetical protein [Nocardia zapadnayensis]MCX0271559.1 hypothetical protein [Nocardia zapadnayensis]